MTLFLSIILVLAFGWFVYAFPNLLAFTTAMAEWCQTIFLQCIEYLLIIKISFSWLGFIIVAAVFLYAVLKAAFMLFKTQRRIRNLPLVLPLAPLGEECGDVMIIKDDELKTAFTHGLLNPKIYLSSGLVNSLDSSELKAVYLHELHHKKRRDPLRFMLLSILRIAFSYIPISRFAENFIHSSAEAEADDAVVAEMKEPVSLAGAILKVARFNKQAAGQECKVRRNLILEHASIQGVGGSTEARIRRLIQGTEQRIALPAIKTIMASILMAAFLVLSLSLPLFASFPALVRCDTSHCNVHIDKLGKECRNHCKVSKHRH